ncbi:ISLre2 family transposase [Haloimpatiens massiliensis]|uniref:ISLre2 family transposase n=2 Tax=Haloimpatiens massiliensis TaxID=1658110 RepID=UPI001FA81B43|nr:ISLre2 family transposase [Haloimpatiens massiliensis]
MGDIMYIISLNDKAITFNDLEKKIYKYACEEACRFMKKVLTHLDRRLLDERDTKVYRNKGFKHTCLKTIMGNIEFDRRIYEYETDDGKIAYKFLLDEYLQMDTIGHISTTLVEKMVDNVTNVSYRNTAKNIKELTNQEISHTAVWNVVQKLGSKIEEKEERKILLNKIGKLNGKKEVEVLFQEMDGIWLSIQGKDRPKGKKSKKKELKLGVSYEGWKKRNGSKDAYVVENKIAWASFDSSKKFKELSDASIAEIYNIDEIDTRILNGDGASWIKQSLGEEGVYFQLDPFHRSQAIIRAIQDKKEAHKLIKMLNEGKAEESFEYITNLMIKYSDDENKFKKLEKLYMYFFDNKIGLKPYKLRKEIKMPKAPEGLEYRNLGTMEHNICDVLAQRMKGRKMSWSIRGANNLAKILAEKASKRIYNVVNEMCSSVISDDELEKITEMITLTAADVNKKVGKGKVYPIHQGKMPFTGCANTNGRKAIRALVENKGFNDLGFI